MIRLSFGPAFSTNSELHCIWRNSKLSVHSFFASCFFFGSLSQFLLVTAKSRLANSFSHASSGKSSFFAKLTFCRAETHKPDSSVPCMAALKTLHLNSNSTLLPELTPASATRSRLRSFVFPSVAKDMFQVKRLSKYPTFVFEFPARIPCHAACVRLICTDCDPPPRATTTFSSFFKFCAMPIAAIALQNCSFSSAAYDKIVRTSSAIRIFACRGRGSLQPRGNLHFLPGACSAGISSSGGEF